MGRPTLQDLELLRKAIYRAPDGLEDCFVISGRVQDIESGKPLQGGLVFRPTQNKKYTDVWRWKLCMVTGEDMQPKPMLPPAGSTYPCWDGIHDGDIVTEGHVQALREAGKL